MISLILFRMRKEILLNFQVCHGGRKDFFTRRSSSTLVRGPWIKEIWNVSSRKSKFLRGNRWIILYIISLNSDIK